MKSWGLPSTPPPALLLAFLLALVPGPIFGQEPPTIEELELDYSSKVSQHQSALDAWEALEIRFQRALEELSLANASGDSDRVNTAFTRFQQLANEISLQKRRVDDIAEELRTARSALLRALAEHLDDLIEQRDAAVDPQEQRELAAILDDRNRRYLELRAEEDPETTLEPMRDLTIDPRDTPENIIRKAESLEIRGNQYEAQLADVVRRLEVLEQDQRRARQVRDFVAGVERYDDTRLPVVASGTRAVTATNPGQRPVGADSLGVEAPPMTLEERIERLQVTRIELESRLQQVRTKAELFRRRARGGTP